MLEISNSSNSTQPTKNGGDSPGQQEKIKKIKSGFYLKKGVTNLKKYESHFLFSKRARSLTGGFDGVLSPSGKKNVKCSLFDERSTRGAEGCLGRISARSLDGKKGYFNSLSNFLKNKKNNLRIQSKKSRYPKIKTQNQLITKKGILKNKIENFIEKKFFKGKKLRIFYVPRRNRNLNSRRAKSRKVRFDLDAKKLGLRYFQRSKKGSPHPFKASNTPRKGKIVVTPRLKRAKEQMKRAIKKKFTITKKNYSSLRQVQSPPQRQRSARNTDDLHRKPFKETYSLKPSLGCKKEQNTTTSDYPSRLSLDYTSRGKIRDSKNKNKQLKEKTKTKKIFGKIWKSNKKDSYLNLFNKKKKLKF